MTRSVLLLLTVLLPLTAQPPRDDHKNGRKGDRRNDRREDESWAERRVGDLSHRFDLSDTQRTQAIAIFTAADQAAEPLEDKLEQARRKLREATRRNANVSELEQLAAPLGLLLGQLELIEAKAETAFHNTLTPKQREDARRPPPPPRRR